MGKKEDDRLEERLLLEDGLPLPQVAFYLVFFFSFMNSTDWQFSTDLEFGFANN